MALLISCMCSPCAHHVLTMCSPCAHHVHMHLNGDFRFVIKQLRTYHIKMQLKVHVNGNYCNIHSAKQLTNIIGFPLVTPMSFTMQGWLRVTMILASRMNSCDHTEQNPMRLTSPHKEPQFRPIPVWSRGQLHFTSLGAGMRLAPRLTPAYLSPNW